MKIEQNSDWKRTYDEVTSDEEKSLGGSPKHKQPLTSTNQTMKDQLKHGLDLVFKHKSLKDEIKENAVSKGELPPSRSFIGKIQKST